MKTAISIPDEVFRRAEVLARRLKRSRSRLYSDAVAEYVRRHSPEELTQAIDAALLRIGQVPDRFATAAARRTLRRTAW